MLKSSRLIAGALSTLLFAAQHSAHADLKMPAIFGDHMVLQDGMPVPVWGTGDPGEAVRVTLGGVSAKTTVRQDGKWMVTLPAMPITMQGVTMTVAGKNTLQFLDVLVGEVWVCSGQSNMEFPLSRAHNAPTELPEANDLLLRFFHVTRKSSHTPVSDVVGKWQICTPQSAAPFSAVGYFFAKDLRAKLNRPVGLIGSYWGGTPAQAWTSLEGLKAEPSLGHFVADWTKINDGYAEAESAYPALKQAYSRAIADWNSKYLKAYVAAMDKWHADAMAATRANQPAPPRPAPPVPAPVAPHPPEGGSGTPAVLYDGMIAPLQPYAIRGVIWYQGESNSGDAEEYATLFPRMIKDWREKWGEGDFPFLWVQLAGFHADDTDHWPVVRDAQLRTLALPHTGMATAVDIGEPNDIHPIDKLDVGKRLALAALHVAYGQNIVSSGPLFKSVKKDGNALRVDFQSQGSGLAIGKAPWVGPGARALPEDHLIGFEVAGADGKWQPADAKIDGDSVVVSSAVVKDLAQVRYDWKSSPEGNLYNKEGLPASPFTGKVK